MKSHLTLITFFYAFSKHLASFAKTFSCFAVKFRFTKFLYTLCFFLLAFNLSAQNERISEIISSVAEELADDETDPDAVEAFIDRLHDLNEKPVSINSSDETELSRLFFLTDFQVKSLLDYVHTSGRIVSLYEIANIPGFDRDLARILAPFISLDDNNSNHGDSIKVRSSLLSNFSVRYPESYAASPGSPWKIFTRYRFSAGSFSGGLTSEKDGGEKLLSGKTPLPDFLSANLSWTGKGVVRKLIAGDFGARFGMGTNINTGLRTGLSLTQSGYLSGKDEIRPYTSSDENIFFRGVAAELQIKKTGLSLFYSINRIDATIDTAENKTDLYINTFYKSGLHNTLLSESKKDVVAEYCYGINLSSEFKSIRLGLLWSASRFSLPVKRIEPDPEDIYDFRGNRIMAASAYYKAVVGKMVLYGELSSNLNSRIAFIQGIVLRPADRLSVNLLYRNYHPGFTSFHGKGLFSNSTGDNIKGLFGNFTFEAARHLFIIAGCDLRCYPWLKYRCSAPSTALSREVRIRFLPSENISFEGVYCYRMTVLNQKESFGIKKQENHVGRAIKGVLKYSPSENMTFGTRIDYKITQPGAANGMLLLQDFNYRFMKVPVSIWFRYCIFKTDTWDSRLYTYENDLLYNFSIPALSGEGNRCYLMIAWEPFRFADFRIKYAFTELIQNRNSFSETDEVKIQLRMWF
jgi:hypothetical protein